MINRVVLVGRLTRDIEVRKTTTGLSVASFTLACDRRGASKDAENSTDFIRCVAWRQSADFLGQYARKGARIGVDGRLQTHDYEKDGQRITVTEVVAENVTIEESRAESEARMQNTSSSYPDNFFPSESSNTVSSDTYEDELDLTSEDLPF